jgi:hypothetical protein
VEKSGVAAVQELQNERVAFLSADGESGLIINIDKNELLGLTCQSEPC